MSGSAPAELEQHHILRTVEIFSKARLACFSDKHLRGTPFSPWNKEFLRELSKALREKRVSAELSVEIHAAIKVHYWNANLCASIYPAIQTAEVLYRNSFDVAIKKEFKKNAWLVDPPTQLDTAGLLESKTRGDIKKAKKSAEDKYQGDPNYKPHHSDILAELDFGFWVSLVKTHPKGGNLEQKRKELWEKILGGVIPCAEGEEKSRDQLCRWLINAQEVRNTLAHHHPLWVSKDEMGLFGKLQAKKIENDKKVLELLKSRRDLIYRLINAIDTRYGVVTRGEYDRLFEKVLSQVGAI
jgi:hypothetical protein